MRNLLVDTARQVVRQSFDDRNLGGAMDLFGDQLKAARNEREITLEQVHTATFISRRYLTALERSDLDALPGGSFDTGYIRSYAEFLGVEAQPILEAYAAEARNHGHNTPEAERAMREKLLRLLGRNGDQARPTRRRPAWLLALITILVAFTLAAFWTGLRRTASDPFPEGISPEGRVSGTAIPVAASSTLDEIASEQKRFVNLPSSPIEIETSPALPASALTIPELGVGTDVVDLALKGKSDRFAEGSRLYFWTRVAGGSKGDVVRHLWLHQGRLYMNAELTIGGSHWRTYSSFRLPIGATGVWSVVARNADGQDLESVTFLAIAAADEP